VGELACEAIELPLLDYVGGGILITGNPALEVIDMGSLTRVEAINITTNESLSTIGGLPSLTTVSTTTAIANNQSLPQCEVDDIATRIDCGSCYDNDDAGVCD
jgi:hypothetical protein